MQWDDEADVVIVGFGGSGAAAAVEAREAGADVLAIDRFRGGGSTHYSGGVNYAAGTRYQAMAGFDDTAEEMFKYLSAEGSAVSSETLRRYCYSSNGNIEWLEAHGVQYGGNAYLNKTAFPPDGYWLYYAGNEKLPRFKEKSKPAPRGHRPVTPGFAGHFHYAKLRASAEAQGVRVLPHSPARQLILDKSQRVIGVVVNVMPESSWSRHDALCAVANPWRPLINRKADQAVAECRELETSTENLRRIRARRGLIISTGGFIYNLNMLEQYKAVLAQNYMSILRMGSMGDDGSGIALGQSVGAKVGYMDRAFIGRPISPPESFLSGVVVNTEGKRFVNEDAYQSIFGDILSEQPNGGEAYLILDRNQFWLGVKQSFFPGKGMFKMWGAPALLNIFLGGTKRAGTLKALARKCGIDAGGLEKTVSEYNSNATARRPDAFGKAAENVSPIARPSYYAVNLSLSNRFGPTFAFTLGGLVPDEETGLVRAENGGVIKGLYVAGRAGVGLCSKGYVSGLSIADTVFSGRRAGSHAAKAAGEKANDSAPSQARVIAG